MFPNDAGTAHTGARPRRLPATSPTAISRLGCRTGNGSWTSPGIKARDGKGVPLAAGRLPRRQDRRVHGRLAPTPGSPTGCSSTLPEGAHPLVRSDRGCHCRWPGCLALMDRYGPARSTGAKGCSPDNAAAEGFFGRMKTESVHPGRWEERRPRRGARPGRRLHPLVRPRAHQTAARLDESGTIPSEPGNGCVIISKKTSAAPY